MCSETQCVKILREQSIFHVTKSQRTDVKADMRESLHAKNTGDPSESGGNAYAFTVL